jgi:hypothetical protein
LKRSIRSRKQKNATGVDVITIFGDFIPIFDEKMAFLLKNNVMVNFHAQDSSILSQKTPFLPIFLAKIFSKPYNRSHTYVFLTYIDVALPFFLLSKTQRSKISFL